jgi:AraC-like DNA-binding protein
MPKPTRRLYALTLNKVHAEMLARGISTPDLLAGTELSEADLADPYKQISDAQARMYCRNAVKLADTDGLGLEIGSMSSLSDLGPQGISQLTAQSIREAVVGAKANYAVHHLLVDWDLDISEQCVYHRVSSREPDERLRIFLIERALATLQSHTEQLTGSHITPLRLLLDYKAPAYAQRYKEVFRCPVSFGQDRIELFYCAEVMDFDLDAQLDTYDPLVRDVLVTLRDSLREKLASKGDILSDVRMALRRTHGEFPGLEAVADGLAMSSRTLRRKLGEHNTTFQSLLDEERRRVAEDYLLNTSLSIQQIADKCGFSDPQNFSQAFRRWSGVSPTEYRGARQE